jgi:AraC-like DNA-binding protein
MDWLGAAFQCVASAGVASVVLGESAKWGATPLPGHPDPKKILPQFGLHGHEFPEFCLSLYGPSRISTDKHAYDFSPPRLALLSPGVLHAEGFSSRQRAYAVMWFHYCSDNSLIARVSEYRPREGWQCPQRYTLRLRTVRQLRDKLSAASLSTPAAFAPIRADILSILAEIHRRDAYGSAAKTGGRALRASHEDVLERVREFLDHNFTEPIDIHTVAALTSFTPNYLNSLFSRWKGQGIHAYLIARRMKRAMELCGRGELLVKEVAQHLGYSDALYFSRAFHRFHGCWPTESGAREEH